MSSIRPLITITILVVVGAYLYVKINEGPATLRHGESSASNQPYYDVPPLAAASDSGAASESPAPPWPATVTPAPAPAYGASSEVAASMTAAAPTDALPTVADVASDNSPAMPPIPDMPEFATTSQPVAPPLPTELPANIPTARYPDQPAINETGVSVGAAASATAPSGGEPVTVQPVTAPMPTTQEPPLTPEQANAVIAAASDLASPPLATQPNPLRESSQPAAEVDRYASGAPPTAPLNVGAAASPVEPSFADSWPTIQAALDRGELARAHQLLSRWYEDPSLTPIDAERVESLLGQLAGTVVYSTEHQLAPAHVVKQGETLETIAKEYNVPWQLLAKINSIPAADAVRPGQELKVVRGPFSAVVDLERNQLTLMIDGRYAGKFPLSVAPDQTVGDGQWVVDQKFVAPTTERAIVLRGDAATPGAAAPTVVIASALLTVNSANAGSTIHVSAKDAEELSDILSVGSRVVIRR